MKKHYLVLFILLIGMFLFPDMVSGQVTGSVVDGDGKPLIGVIVQKADGATSTTTDFDGYFELNVAEGTPLEAAFLGYKKVSVNASRNMRIVLLNKGAKPKKEKAVSEDAPLPWSMFILANGMTGFPFSPAVGATVGMVRKGGWYINFMSGFGGHFTHSTESAYDGCIKSNDNLAVWSLPFYTGEYTKQTMSLTVGGVARLSKAPVYLYAGTGWAYKSVTFETNSGDWVAYTTESWNDWSPRHSLALETGVMANIKGFALSVGYEVMLGFHETGNLVVAAHEIKIGIGGMFNIKRGTQK